MEKKSDRNKRIAEYWDEVTAAPPPHRTRWWDSPLILDHINRLVSGISSKVYGDGLLEIVRQSAQNKVFERGISVGCGYGDKEMRLIQAGVVKTFDLFEFSGERIRVAKDIAKKMGVTEFVTFRCEDAFEVTEENSYDFVHWSSSLHHMFDVEAAVAWSHKVLQPGGMFYLDDYVGPARFQWSDASLELAKRIRSLLPKRYLRDPKNVDEQLSCEVIRPHPDSLTRLDPSEAVESDKILDAVRRYFPDAKVTLTGGTVYHLALNDVLYNLDEDDESEAAILQLLMLIDELCTKISEFDNHYAVAIAIKP